MKKKPTMVKALNVKPSAVAKLDALAKQSHMSRSAYLKHFIESDMALRDFKEFEDRYQALVNKMCSVIEQNTLAFHQLLEILGDEHED